MYPGKGLLGKQESRLVASPSLKTFRPGQNKALSKLAAGPALSPPHLFVDIVDICGYFHQDACPLARWWWCQSRMLQPRPSEGTSVGFPRRRQAEGRPNQAPVSWEESYFCFPSSPSKSMRLFLCLVLDGAGGTTAGFSLPP